MCLLKRHRIAFSYCFSLAEIPRLLGPATIDDLEPSLPNLQKSSFGKTVKDRRHDV